MQIKAAIFDLDGTLADTIEAIRDAINLTMQQYGYPPHTYEEIREYIGNGAKNLVLRSMPADAAGDTEQHARVFLTYQDNYDRGHLATDRCYDGMPELIASLSAKGVKLAVLSNKQDRYVKKIMEAYFDEGVLSMSQGQRVDLPVKPDPTVPLMIAQRFNVTPDDCAFIGDSDVDVKTAKNSGMVSVACPWGYRPREELLDADFIIEDADELTLLFE